MRTTLLSVLGLALMLVSCNESKVNETPVEKPRKVVEVKKPAVPTQISIYMYEGFERAKAERLRSNLQEFFPNIVLKEKVLELPKEHYYKPRNRYRGSGLYDFAGKHRNGDCVLAVTDQIIFWKNEKSDTYGIMGIAPVGAYKGVISSKRPKNGKAHSDENLCKLALHEMGHAFGLNHCPDQKCFMVDAEHGYKFPQTTGFCSSCKEKLNKVDWKIK